MRSAEQMKAIRERLADLELQGGGRLTPNAVLEDAKDPDSPLHDSFEWDDEKAAHAHRIEQARALITSVRVVQRTDKTAVRAVFYVRDPSAENDEQGYVSTSTLRSDQDMAREAVVAEFTRVADALRRAREIAKALDLGDEIEGLLRSVVDLRERIQPAPSAQQ